MSSPRRSRRSRSSSRSPDPPMLKSKRNLDLVSTRRLSPPSHSQYHQRGFRGGRGRSSRRPFIHRGGRGAPFYRGSSHPQKYYPRYQRYNSRDDSHSHHHQQGHNSSWSQGRSRERSRSRSHRHKSRSASSSSESGSRHRRRRSRSVEHRSKGSKDVKLSHLRNSSSPERKAPVKKKSRQSSPSPEMDRLEKPRPDSSEKMEFDSGSQQPTASKPDDDYSNYESGRPATAEEGRQKVRKFRERSRSTSPELHQSRRTAEGVKGKELIPRGRLHKIFSLISQDADFELDEDISIAIQRNPYAEPSEDSTVTVVFNEKLFTMIYPYENRKHKPIFDREEILMFGHDKNLADDPDFERRLIRLKPGKSSQQADPGSSSSYQYRSSMEITRTVKRNRSKSPSRSRSRSATPKMTKQRAPQFRLRVSTDPRFEARYAEVEDRDEPRGSSSRSKLEPNDLRHELSSNRKSDSRSRLDRSGGRYDQREASVENRESKQERKKDDELPDYSRRKDKYQYTPWLDQPELIPKDPKYFMHDDREHLDPRNRGRGRGRFFRGRGNYSRPFRPYRGRGNFRSPYRGRGNYTSDSRPKSPRRNYYRSDDRSVEREWKHDKFSELESDGDKKSHRDDDQHPHSTSER